MVAKGDHDISTEHCGHRSLRFPPSLSIVLSSHVFLDLDFAGGKTISPFCGSWLSMNPRPRYVFF
jgi:hypothetical protein